MCFTNHALDDFLEGLLDVGIRDIVRLGGRSKSERLVEFNLREKAKSGKAPFSREQTRRYAQLKQSIEDASKEVNGIQKKLRREIGKAWWATVEPHLRSTHQEEWMQLRIEDLSDTEGFKMVGIENHDHLWKLWVGGKKACAPYQDRNEMPLWQLSKHERVLKKLEWQHELYEDDRRALEGSFKTIKTAKDELKQLQDSKDSIILSNARIIGCTTTKAAMCKHLLDEISAETVLVEEAAEIFESHVLTSLSKNTKRLIMIGDHKQLRPKAQHYPLTVESNRQYDLNRSLFERLALQLPPSRLGIQHRMHPMISAIPRLITYPELKDEQSTANRPMVKGLQSRLIFIDHNQAEDFHRTEIERIDAISKTNQHEVDLVVAIVRYLFQQGYKPSNLVVLTPYLGQLLKVQQALSSIWNVFIDDSDYNEARRLLQGVDGFESFSPKGSVDSSVRVATIDNYQGEEADIVIASLVRGNADHNIGFLREQERVNVLLSRARICEIVIGNRATLEGARGSNNPLRGGLLWKTIFSHLDSQRNVFGGLPVVCQTHSKEAILRTANEIESHSPDGGCSERCTKVLDCGHPCTKQCHVGPCIKCSVLCPDKCPRGHSVVRECSEANPPKCLHVIGWKCPLGHALSGPCFKGQDSADCSGCHLLREREEEQLQVERKMQEALDRKHRGLNETRDQLQEALRDSLHRQQMSMIDEEQALVERQLEEARQKNIVSSTGSGDSGQSTNSTSQGIAGSELFLKDLTAVVRTLFGQSDSSTLPASKIADFYEKQCGRNLQLDADRRIGNADGSQMALKSIFERLSCCDVILSTDSGKKKRRRKAVLVRLVDQAPRFESEGVSNKVDSNVRYNKEEKDGMNALPTRRAGKCATDDLNSICVANISESTTEADLRNSFQSYGCLLLIDISKDEEGRHALVSFVSSKDAARAMEDLDGCPCGESTLKLEWAQSNASFKLTPPAKKARLDEKVAVLDNSRDKAAKEREVSRSLVSNDHEHMHVECSNIAEENEVVCESPSSATHFEIVSDVVSDVVKRYIHEGALAADNLLDEIKTEDAYLNASEIQSIDYVIAQELDPSGNLSRPPSKSSTGSSLCEVVCLYAYSLYCASHDFPLQAQDFARRALMIVKSKTIQIPKDWLDRAEDLSSSPLNDERIDRSRKEDTPKEKWALVLTSDRRAPAVMNDSVLPMIGLKSVKNSMIGMYHRVKLAQEQNDGVAASYNIRFEGNPGTG